MQAVFVALQQTRDAFLESGTMRVFHADAALAEAWRRHGELRPGLAFYLAGADPHEGDRLGRLKLSDAGLAERDRRVLAALRARRIPAALSMAGGYGRELAATVAVHRDTLEQAEASWRAWAAECRP